MVIVLKFKVAFAEVVTPCLAGLYLCFIFIPSCACQSYLEIHTRRHCDEYYVF